MLSVEYWWVLFLLPLPLIVRWCVPEGFLSWQSALKIPFFSRLSTITDGQSSRFSASKFHLALASLIWISLVVASANPVWLGKPIAISRSGRALMLAVDLSQSMEIRDMRWKNGYARRFDVVKAVASQFIQERKGDRLGLILFGSNAYLQTPLTFDRKTVKEMMQDASVGLAGPTTAIGDAIGLAIKRLQDYPDHEKVLVLLTDGADNSSHVDPIAVAKLAAKKHIRIHTIGLASNSRFSQDLDENLLRRIADQTGGNYFRATDTYALKKVYDKLNKLEPVKADKTFFRPKTPIYPYFLLFSLLLFLISASCKSDLAVNKKFQKLRSASGL